VNASVVDAPELINESPYDEGWLIRIRPGDLSEVEQLLSAAEYQRLLAEQ